MEGGKGRRALGNRLKIELLSRRLPCKSYENVTSTCSPTAWRSFPIFFRRNTHLYPFLRLIFWPCCNGAIAPKGNHPRQKTCPSSDYSREPLFYANWIINDDCLQMKVCKIPSRVNGGVGIDQLILVFYTN